MAADINHVVLVGNLTRDAELKYTSGGMAVCAFSIAVNYNKKSGDQWTKEVNFFDIVVFGRQGESIHQYLVKGKQIGVSGELRQERWEQEGQTRSKVKVIASNIQLLGGGGQGASGGFQGSGGRQFQNGPVQNRPAQNGSDQYGGRPAQSAGPDDFDDDIPF